MSLRRICMQIVLQLIVCNRWQTFISFLITNIKIHMFKLPEIMQICDSQYSILSQIYRYRFRSLLSPFFFLQFTTNAGENEWFFAFNLLHKSFITFIVYQSQTRINFLCRYRMFFKQQSLYNLLVHLIHINTQ